MAGTMRHPPGRHKGILGRLRRRPGTTWDDLGRLCQHPCTQGHFLTTEQRLWHARETDRAGGPGDPTERAVAKRVGCSPATTRRNCGAYGRPVKVGPAARASRAPHGAPLTTRPHARCSAEVEAGKTLPGSGKRWAVGAHPVCCEDLCPGSQLTFAPVTKSASALAGRCYSFVYSGRATQYRLIRKSDRQPHARFPRRRGLWRVWAGCPRDDRRGSLAGR
jgi:hypothetical protein